MKKQLIDKIQSTEDINILEEVYRILEVSTREVDMVVLSDEQKAKIDQGISDIEGGRFLTHDEAKKETDQWLKK